MLGLKTSNSDNRVHYLTSYATYLQSLNEYLCGCGVKQGLILNPGDGKSSTSCGCAAKGDG